jgi:hypothetical protein
MIESELLTFFKPKFIEICYMARSLILGHHLTLLHRKTKTNISNFDVGIKIHFHHRFCMQTPFNGNVKIKSCKTFNLFHHLQANQIGNIERSSDACSEKS